MPNGLNNWTYENVAEFLEQHFFEQIYIEDSHHFFKGLVDGEERLTWVPKHGNKSLVPLTLDCTIGKSGIPKKYWRDWAKKDKRKRREVQYEGAVKWTENK